MSDALRERLLAERDERRRIAELVHDGPVQYISALIQMVEALIQALDADDPAAARTIATRALEVAREGAVELREIVHGLEPPTLHALGLVPALRELAERIVGLRGVALDLDLENAPKLGESASSGLYQVARETLDQAIRRGPPTTVRIAIRRTTSGGVELEIADDGAPERRQAVIDGLVERVGDLNGRVETTSEGAWTTTRVTLPPSALHL
ncbi:MAG: histidine kinase [Gaiellales bacterium]